MPNIVHRIGMEQASPEQVYVAVATRKGLASWWTEKVTGEPRVGNVLQFRFETGGSDFEVLEMTPPKRVRWKCVAVPNNGSIRASILISCGRSVKPFFSSNSVVGLKKQSTCITAVHRERHS